MVQLRTLRKTCTCTFYEHACLEIRSDNWKFNGRGMNFANCVGFQMRWNMREKTALGLAIFAFFIKFCNKRKRLVCSECDRWTTLFQSSVCFPFFLIQVLLFAFFVACFEVSTIDVHELRVCRRRVNVFGLHSWPHDDYVLEVSRAPRGAQCWCSMVVVR